ncbi:hypothetical protein D0Y65_001104 [Glycine soja]|uniref:Uncharacterized protein n=1 Tax=Glycine soja TaxID=3848 RepID=A0A445M1K6_GLYSO|nr:hypothetical protein D0Y65_001104 [Glycine soja]
MSKRLQEDWARAAEEGPRILMNLRTHLLLEVASPLSLPSLFRCHSSSKKQRNPLMKKILGLQAPMELTSELLTFLHGIRVAWSRGFKSIKHFILNGDVFSWTHSLREGNQVVDSVANHGLTLNGIPSDMDAKWHHP